MSLKKAWMVLAVLVILNECLYAVDGCWEHERIALLKLRTVFDGQALGDWVESELSSDCCQWERVVCDNSTKNVINLDLSYAKEWRSPNWYLNISLFLPLDKLQALSLAVNNIGGFVEDEGFERLSQLEYLDLRWNNMFLNSSIMSSISALSTLKSLSLSSNFLETFYLEDLNNFVSLKYLDLSFNGIEAFKSSEATVTQLRLSNLEVLDLSYNLFDNSILKALNGLSSLKSLHLHNNRLNGSIYIKDVLLNLEELDVSGNRIEEFVTLRGDHKNSSKLKILYLKEIDTDINILLQSLGSTFPLLRTLDLSTNIFNKTTTTLLKLDNLTNLEDLFLDESTLDTSIFRSMDVLSSLKQLTLTFSKLHGPLTVQDLPNFKKLEVLNISYTTLDSSFFQSIGEMDALKILRLSDSGLNGGLSWASGLCRLIYLRELDLSYNKFVENLPACLANFTFIRIVDLSGNQLTGNITESPLTSLTSLEELSLDENYFQIPISLGPFYNHSKLTTFKGGKNMIYADNVPQSLAPKFQLKTISLSYCGDAGAFPQFLYHQHDLLDVDLSRNHLKGNFPNWLLDNNTSLNVLGLADNSLSGLLSLPAHSLMHLKWLDISQNLFYGRIPVEFGEYFPRMEYLDMALNRITGNIPSSFGYMSSLDFLDLSNNQLIGNIPEHLGKGCISLRDLLLSNNSLQGQIFSQDFNLVNLETLQLDRNQFKGKIPDSLSVSSSLSVFDISNNHISGPIPKWMGNLSSLREIKMANNHLECEIPVEFCQLSDLQILDLSDSDILSLPSCFAPSVFEMSLSGNRLNGTLNDFFSNSSSISILDLSDNHLTGSIPHEIKRFPLLVFLFLSNNYLEGEIPVELCKLQLLSWLDLSHNDLSGKIPNCLHITMIEDAYNATVDDSANVALAPETSITEQSVEFKTKWMSYPYHGEVLKYMSGIDLSCNKFSDKIPPEIGNLSSLLTLNLSYNSLSGHIPKTFGNLKRIESMDLSNNLLSGNVPQELCSLNYLGVFSVTNNNLSGEIPSSGQIGGFTESSYEGNTLLCGTQLRKSCREDGTSGSTTPSGRVDNGEDDGFMDMTAFYASLTTTFLVVLLGLVTVLLVNPYWRRWWFYHVEKWTFTCYYFVMDNLPKRRFFFRT